MGVLLGSEIGGELAGSATSTVKAKPTVKVFMIAANPPTGDAVVIDAEGANEAEAVATAKAQVPRGWRTMSVRRV